MWEDNGLRSLLAQALRDGMVLAGITLFWILIWSIGFGIETVTSRFNVWTGHIKDSAHSIAFFNVILYLIIRSGTVLIDYYHETVTKS